LTTYRRHTAKQTSLFSKFFSCLQPEHLREKFSNPEFKNLTSHVPFACNPAKPLSSHDCTTAWNRRLVLAQYTLSPAAVRGPQSRKGVERKRQAA
jgi:hypothetical protein